MSALGVKGLEFDSERRPFFLKKFFKIEATPIFINHKLQHFTTESFNF